MRDFAAVFGLAMISGAAVAEIPAPLPASHPLLVSGGVMAGNLLSRVNPVLPKEAEVQHVSGTVILQVKIGTDGRVQNVRAISGPESLRQAAVDAVSQWVYKPYLLDGVPVAVDTTVSLVDAFRQAAATGDVHSTRSRADWL